MLVIRSSSSTTTTTCSCTAMLLLIFLAGFCWTQTFAVSACGTRSDPRHVEELQTAIREYTREHSGENSSETTRLLSSNRQAEFHYDIALAFHVFGNDTTTKNALTSGRQQNVLRDLRHGFRDTKFTFEIQDVREHVEPKVFDNPQVYSDSSKHTRRFAKEHNVRPLSTTANIYVMRLYKDGRFQQKPGFPPGHEEEAIFIRHWFDWEDDSHFAQVLIHEMGHFLGLDHTFYVKENRTNCNPPRHIRRVTARNYKGRKIHKRFNCLCDPVNDGIQDTAVHMFEAHKMKYANSCFRDPATHELRVRPDTCRMFDGKDPIDNYMNYPTNDCSREFGKFTPGQIEAMYAWWEQRRFKLLMDPFVTLAPEWRVRTEWNDLDDGSLSCWAIDSIQFYSREDCLSGSEIAIQDGATAFRSTIEADSEDCLSGSEIADATAFHSTTIDADSELGSTLFDAFALYDAGGEEVIPDSSPAWSIPPSLGQPMWIGIVFPEPVTVKCVQFRQSATNITTHSRRVVLEARESGKLYWQPIVAGKGLPEGDELASIENHAERCLQKVLERCACRRYDGQDAVQKCEEWRLAQTISWKCKQSEDDRKCACEPLDFSKCSQTVSHRHCRSQKVSVERKLREMLSTSDSLVRCRFRETILS